MNKTKISFFKLTCNYCNQIVYTPMYLFFRLRHSSCPICGTIILETEDMIEK